MPDWADYVAAEPDALWSDIQELVGSDETGDAAKEAISAASDDAQKAIYDNVWAASSGFTGFIVNNLWILVSAALVFLMHLGFASLESGLCQRKNTVNVLFKNCWIISIGVLTYFVWGFNAHYPGGWVIDGWLAFGSPANGSDILLSNTNLYNPAYVYWTDFIFQAMFAATAATIVSGAVAERIKLGAFMIYAVILVMIGYPLAGAWHWGGGILNSWGFADFAGSTVVHAFGGFAALAAVLVLGPRKGKYTKNGTKPILGHSLPLATIGVFLLFLGWFGFNGGSVLSAEPSTVAHVFVTTTLAAIGGAITSIFTSWIVIKKPDLSMSLNGFLAGLVGITAGADILSSWQALVVGALAGIIVVFSILILDKLKIDDPVGAISVHGVCGIFGTLACVLGGADFLVQLGGTLLVCAFGFVFSFVTFFILKKTIGIRVPEEMEMEGLDVEEHGAPAYGDLMVNPQPN
ncbi:ammonium transporter [Sulfuriroseicoccus oceanibius]|uniref:Ammonium transporter n=2 Tax=Sulfuriroseicoccus oceanibius TaxID=2707525 RepID=A0A6B3L5X7_9BACT|nr:ammonium transporter [Sulfuriroseicoccus oceanibius]